MKEPSAPEPLPPDEGEGAGALTALGTIAVLNRDLMFGVRIGNTLRSLGYEVRFARDTETFAGLLQTTRPAPTLGVIDMNAPVDWALVRALVDDPETATPLLAFGPHTDAEGRRAAKAAGVQRLVSNGEFHRGMVALVRRYARPVSSDSTPSSV